MQKVICNQVWDLIKRSRIEAPDFNLLARGLRWYRYSQFSRATAVSHLLT